MNNAPSLSFRRSTLASFATHAALFATLGTAPAGAGELCEQQPKLTASDGAGPHQFGYSVAISGHTAIVGANQDNDNGFGS
ncbi:MAG: FG-GAP repeat protein, partial [Phycisphaerae bacterium]|nr:FG-GAP repeat protein [Phycisphaerae bacterium]